MKHLQVVNKTFQKMYRGRSTSLGESRGLVIKSNTHRNSSNSVVRISKSFEIRSNQTKRLLDLKLKYNLKMQDLELKKVQDDYIKIEKERMFHVKQQKKRLRRYYPHQQSQREVISKEGDQRIPCTGVCEKENQHQTQTRKVFERKFQKLGKMKAHTLDTHSGILSVGDKSSDRQRSLSLVESGMSFTLIGKKIETLNSRKISKYSSIEQNDDNNNKTNITEAENLNHTSQVAESSESWQNSSKTGRKTGLVGEEPVTNQPYSNSSLQRRDYTFDNAHNETAFETVFHSTHKEEFLHEENGKKHQIDTTPTASNVKITQPKEKTNGLYTESCNSFENVSQTTEVKETGSNVSCREESDERGHNSLVESFQRQSLNGDLPCISGRRTDKRIVTESTNTKATNVAQELSTEIDKDSANDHLTELSPVQVDLRERLAQAHKLDVILRPLRPSDLVAYVPPDVTFRRRCKGRKLMEKSNPIRERLLTTYLNEKRQLRNSITVRQVRNRSQNSLFNRSKIFESKGLTGKLENQIVHTIKNVDTATVRKQLVLNSYRTKSSFGVIENPRG